MGTSSNILFKETPLKEIWGLYGKTYATHATFQNILLMHLACASSVSNAHNCITKLFILWNYLSLNDI